jgi:hypothetical protein
MTNNQLVPVIFRVWNGSPHDVFALFPTIPEGVCSYQHVGQHGAADYALCIKHSRPAALEEYASLANELTRIGYDFRVVARRSPQMRGEV